MEITSEISSLITDKKEDFEKKFKESLVTDTLRQVISKSVPANEVESKRLNDPDFRDKFNKILSPVSQKVINQFENVGQFNTGNLFSSMINSISDSVALESTYRANCAFNDIRLNRVPEDSIEASIESHFNKLKFSSKDIGRRAIQNFKMILSTEDASEILDDIKDEVKGAIEETEDKNELVEGTTKEIIDYKKEMAPPEDQYKNPEDEDNDEGEDDEEDQTDGGLGSNEDQESETDSENTQDDGNEDPTGEGNINDENSNENESDAGLEESNQNNETPEEGGNNPSADVDGGNDNVNGGLGSDDNGGLGSDDGSSNDGGLGSDDNGGLGSDDGSSNDGGLGSDDNGGLGSDDGSMDVDVNKEVSDDMGEDMSKPNNPPANEEAVASQNSGIVINITGADLAKGKESLTISTAERFASKIPTHPRTFDEMKLPSVSDLSSEACNVMSGDIENELNIRFDSLSYGIRQIKDHRSVESLNAKLLKMKNISKKALDMANGMRTSLYMVGLTPDGLINSKESTFFCAANIIKRFLSKTQKVTSKPFPYTSTENVLTNAFDILQLRQELRYSKGDVDEARAEDLYSRESVFYKNMAVIEHNDPDLVKQATAVIDLTDMKLEKALTTNFITDYKIKAWEVNVGKNANKDMNAEVTKRVEKRFEKLWGRKLNSDEMEIVQAVANNQDVTEIVPNPYEKFLIKLSKDAMFNGKSTESVKYRLTSKEKANIRFKAKLYTAMYKAAEKFNIVDENDRFSINDFCEEYNIM